MQPPFASAISVEFLPPEHLFTPVQTKKKQKKTGNIVINPFLPHFQGEYLLNTAKYYLGLTIEWWSKSVKDGGDTLEKVW